MYTSATSLHHACTALVATRSAPSDCADVPMAPGPCTGKPAGALTLLDALSHLAGCFAGCSPSLRIIGYELLSEAPGALMLPPDLHKHADTDAKLLQAWTKYLALKHLLPSSTGVGGNRI